MNDGQTSPTPTRVFLSYARGDDESFVKRLHADLIEAGFTVWFDRESMMSRGLNFHQEIKDAIRTKVDRVIYVGGPKAAFSNYVREEWQFALECDHVVVTPILRLGDYEYIPGELSLLHCEDFRDDAKYPAARMKLIASLRQPNPKLGALFAVPSLPPNFLGRPELMRRVRDALLVDLQRPQVITSADARVGMQGMGGIGKSVLAAALARNRQVRQAYPDGIAWISCGQRLSDDDQLKRQRDLARHLGGDDTFASLEHGQGVLSQLLGAKAVLLVLDGVWRAADAQAFDVLGPRCRMLVTTRDKGILDTLHGELVPVSLFTETEALQLLADEANTKEHPVSVGDVPPEAHEIVRECGCLPLALALCGGMARKRGGDFHSVLERLRRADLDKIADRESINEQHRSIWRAMQASVEMLAEAEQQRFAELAVFDTEQIVPEAAAATLWAQTGGLDGLDAKELLINFSERSLVQLDQKQGADGKINRRFRLHDLLHDYAVRIACEPRVLHQKLLDAYRKKCPEGWHAGPHDGYFLQNLGRHLLSSGKTDELIELHLNLSWLERKNETQMTFDLPMDFEEVIKALPPDHPKRLILRLLHSAIMRNVDFIARHANDYPQALFQCLWNSGWWHDSPEAASHHESPEAAMPAWTLPGPKLYALLEQWRAAKAKQSPGTKWVRSMRPPEFGLGSGQISIIREAVGGHFALSPNGENIATWCKDGSVGISSIRTGKKHTSLSMFGDSFSCGFLAYSTDGTEIVAIGWNYDHPELRACCLRTGSETWRARIGRHSISEAVFTSSGPLFAASGNKSVEIWNSKSHCVTELPGHLDCCTKVVLSTDGFWAATLAENGEARLWSIPDGKEVRKLGDIGEGITALSFSNDGKCLAMGNKSGKTHVLNLASSLVRVMNGGHSTSVRSVVFRRDGIGLATFSDDGTVRLCNTQTGDELATLRGHTSSATCVAFSDDGSRVVTGHEDKSVRVWDAQTGREIAVLRGHHEPVVKVCFLPGSHLAVSIAVDQTVRLWNADDIINTPPLKEHTNKLRVVCFSPDGEVLATGGDDRTVRTWDSATGVQTALMNHSEKVLDIAFTRDSQVGASLLKKGIQVWDARTKHCERFLESFEIVIEVARLAYVPKRPSLVCGACFVFVYDLASSQTSRSHGKLTFVSAEKCTEDGTINSVAISPDGKMVAAGTRYGCTRIWNFENFSEVASFHNGNGAIVSVAFSSDGKRLAGLSTYEGVEVWDLESKKLISVNACIGDPIAFAEGPLQYPFRAVGRRSETIIEDASSGLAVAWFEEPLCTGIDNNDCFGNIASHVSGAKWAGAYFNHVHLVMLEGYEQNHRYSMEAG